MNKIVQVLLILLALAVLYGFLTQIRQNNRGEDKKSQEQLLDEMSHEELVDLLIRVLPGRPNVPQIQSMTDQELKQNIRFFQKQKNG